MVEATAGLRAAAALGAAAGEMCVLDVCLPS